MNLVSIIITTYNRPEWLKYAIESAVTQTFTPTEVIVVDDGSEGKETRQVAALFPQIKYLYQTNQGLGSARNAGLEVCQGEFIQFLDDDDWLVPTAIAKKLELLKANPSSGIVYSDLYLTDKNGTILGLYYANRLRPLPTGDLYNQLAWRNFIPIHAMLWRREIIQLAGGFPSRSGSEDWEILVHAAETARFEYIDEPLGYYRLHDQNMTLHFVSQAKGDGAVQKYIASSERFHRMRKPEQARILSSFGVEQWLEGDRDLAYQFYRQAHLADSLQIKPIALRSLMLLGKPLSSFLFHQLWKIHSKVNRPSAGDYFLARVGKTSRMND